MRFKLSFLFSAALFLTGCGGNQAAFIPSGVNCVLEQPLQAVASVPDDNGVLQPHTKITMPVGTVFTYDPKYQTTKGTTP